VKVVVVRDSYLEGHFIGWSSLSNAGPLKPNHKFLSITKNSHFSIIEICYFVEQFIGQFN